MPVHPWSPVEAIHIGVSLRRRWLKNGYSEARSPTLHIRNADRCDLPWPALRFPTPRRRSRAGASLAVAVCGVDDGAFLAARNRGVRLAQQRESRLTRFRRIDFS